MKIQRGTSQPHQIGSRIRHPDRKDTLSFPMICLSELTYYALQW